MRKRMRNEKENEEERKKKERGKEWDEICRLAEILGTFYP